MRKILFRGKRIDNGEWVYGAYINMHHNDGRTHIHHFIIPDGNDMSYGVKLEDILVAVDGETVCQYTGLTDKNGNKIFEGDIADRLYVAITGPAHETLIASYDSFAGYKRILAKTYKVVGNIYDNPELLEVQE